MGREADKYCPTVGDSDVAESERKLRAFFQERDRLQQSDRESDWMQLDRIYPKGVLLMNRIVDERATLETLPLLLSILEDCARNDGDAIDEQVRLAGTTYQKAQLSLVRLVLETRRPVAV